MGEPEPELQRLVAEQTALRRVATLVAAGPSEADLVSAVTFEIAQLFGADTASTLRWDGDTIRVIGTWRASARRETLTGRDFAVGGDTIATRVVSTGAPARVDSADDLETDFARARWAELGLQASIGAPIVVDERVWGVVMTSRTTRGDPFPPRAEHRLGEFAALVAQAIANAEAQREVAALAQEQAALRRVATLVAAGRPHAEVLDAVTAQVAELYGATPVVLLRREGGDDVIVVGGRGGAALPTGSAYHPAPGGATLTVLETAIPSRADEPSRELKERIAISAPVIVNATLFGALTALRAVDDPFPVGSEARLQGFADLVGQSIANAQAQAEIRASRARIVRAADDASRRLERGLHEGAQQRLVAVSLSLRTAIGKLDGSPEDARAMLVAASEELTQAIVELRELARGIHPAIITERGLDVALDVLAARAPVEVTVANELSGRLPAPIEAAAYHVVAEALANTARYGNASAVTVTVGRRNGAAQVEVVDDGVGGADASRGSGLRGLADRVEALDGRLEIVSPPGGGTRVRAEIPLA